ncbi:hypothetical protein ACJMK2_001460 [Sinanodonta woodiana]|uniref:Uncharacterized protein n=1 Tax=Sinanodonta woodiana TaxID=1069815 RepID=A0ABD3XVP0_SINWO
MRRYFTLRLPILPLVLIGMLVRSVVHSQQCHESVPQDVLIEIEFLPADNTTTYPSPLVPILMSNASRDVQDAIKATLEENTDMLSDESEIANYYYEDVCPIYDFALPFGAWYFYHTALQMKCFPMQPIYMKWCKTRYCSLDSTKSFKWYHRCIQEWGYKYFWVVGVNQKGTWSLRYVKWRLPVGCSCKRYHKYIFEQCTASDAPKAVL